MNQDAFVLQEQGPKKRRAGMGSHEKTVGDKDEWLTDPSVIKALGEFDLDPCSPINRPWPTAKHHFTIMDNGLMKPWIGRVFCNPPYGYETDRWMQRLSEHGNGIALIFARTETQCWHQWIWPTAHSILFFQGRLTFYHVNGTRASMNAGAPSCLVAYGASNTDALASSGLKGRLVNL